MKVGFLLLHPFSESMASGVRTLELAKALREQGVETCVFTPYEKTHINDGTEIVNVPTFFSAFGIGNQFYHFTRRVYYNNHLQKLLIKFSKRMATGSIGVFSKLVGILKESNIDILQTEQDNAALMALPIRSKLNIPIVLDLHGIWPEELLAANAIRRDSSDWNDLQDLMKKTVNDVDLTVCLSDAMREYVVSNYNNPESQTVVVPPGGRILFDRYVERPDPKKVVYAGIVSYRKHVDLFVKSMDLVKKASPNTEFYITKKGDLLNQLQDLAISLKVNPNYFWFSDFGTTVKFLSSCHIGVHPSTNDISAKLSMPSKFFDYLSVGLPVIANDVGGWTEIVKTNHLGRITADSPKEFARGITELLNDPKEMAQCGRRGIEIIRNKYNWGISASLLHKGYKKLTS